MPTSIGYNSAFSGVTRNPNSFVSPTGKPSALGGGYNGYSPALLGGGANTHGGSGMEGGNERSMDRLLLRQAWNGQYASGLVNKQKPVCTPFRLVNNAGDYLGRQNYVSGGSDQVRGLVRSSSAGAWRMFGGHVQASNDGTGIPSSTCNVKYVYDGSDYTAFKKKQAMNRTYNDQSFGGDASHASQSALSHVRH
uniref:Uncharacterized protein n=1 Tax=viral metagenome TaxID=1070528 RepID=A0A6C0LZR6_9ZZZZ